MIDCKFYLYLFIVWCPLFATLGSSVETGPKTPPPIEKENLRPFEAPLLCQRPEYTPWIVGNILTQSGFVVPYGHFQIQCTSFIRSSNSDYANNWNVVDSSNRLTINSHFNFKLGITKFMDCFFRIEGVYKKINHASTFGFGDLFLGSEFQLYTYGIDSWLPAIRLTLSEFFPTGKYQHLQPFKEKSDALGAGSFASQIALNASHLYQIRGIHYLGVLLDIRYRIFAPVHVHEFNAYGGTSHTNGRVFPGQLLQINQGFQYSLSKKWTFATDFRYRHQSRRRFSGFSGTTAQNPSGNMKKPASDQFIFAPQIEYSWTADIGAIAGAWFTFAGHNTEKFYGAIAQFSYYY
jgi:hypothetical protein